MLEGGGAGNWERCTGSGLTARGGVGDAAQPVRQIKGHRRTILRTGVFSLKTRWPTEPMKIVLVEDRIIGSHVGRNVKCECLMRDQSGVIEFPNGSDSLDRAGQDVLAKLRQAAATSEQTVQHALGVAHQASMQLRTAEDRVSKLEAQMQGYKDRAERAEEWLRHISQEIEQAFPSRRQQQPEDHAQHSRARR